MNSERMELWKQRLETSTSAYQDELDKMDGREKIYRGQYTHKKFTAREDPWEGQAVTYVYNALAENIEAQVSNDIPMPKVTARREQDEHLAVIIENMIRNELDRLPMELINDISERTVPIQGAGMYLVEWDNRRRTHSTVGENEVTFIHPKWVIPQEGVYTGLEDMDYFFLRIPETKEGIKARYGVDVSDEAESEPELKDVGDGKTAESMVTMCVAYYRNENGGVGKYVWCNDTELEDLEDYQARRLCRCGQCGAPQPMEGEVITNGTEEPLPYTEGDPCPVCGARDWLDAQEDYEEIVGPILRSDGTEIGPWEGEGYGTEAGGMSPGMDAAMAGEAMLPGDVVPELTGPGWSGTDTGGQRIMIPYYKPNRFPLVLQRNVSVFGRFLGESDADKLEPLQDGLNRLEQKIFDRFLKAGSKIALPDDTNVRIDGKEDMVIRVGNAADLSMVRFYNFTGDLTQEMAQVNAIYQQMRQTVGVTDSFQGRKDTTATSGTAKQFAAAQAAGRLESKRVMKEAAYAQLFELIFKFRLAYADEPRPVVYQDGQGNTVYDQFNKWDFLERDEAGSFWWNDQFLFACDTTAPLAQNRERMWQETTAFFQAGAFGDPSQLETVVEYWRKMELLHDPGAGQTRKNLQERLETQQAAMRDQAMAQGMQDMSGPAPEESSAPGIADEDLEEMARQAAEADAASAAGM